MPGTRSMRLVESALRCYPQRWRSRHGDEAAEIASLLIRDGTPAHSIAWSYLIGAARTRLVIRATAAPRCRGGRAAAGGRLPRRAAGAAVLVGTGQCGERAPLTHRPLRATATHPRSADPRYGQERGAPDRCDRHAHC